MRIAACALGLILLFLGSAVSTSSSATSRELFNYGREWNAWSDALRSIYLVGFVDGQSSMYVAVLQDLPPQPREPLRLQIFTFYQGDSIRDVMTSLYSDPASTYITRNTMVYIARDKLSGKDVDPMLRRAREENRGYVDK